MKRAHERACFSTDGTTEVLYNEVWGNNERMTY